MADEKPAKAALPEPALSQAPALAMSSLHLASAQALADATHDAVIAQTMASTIALAATAQGVSVLYGLDSAPTALSIQQLLAARDEP